LDEGIADTLVSISAANGFALLSEITWSRTKGDLRDLPNRGETKLERAKKTASFIPRSHLNGEARKATNESRAKESSHD